MPTFNYPTSKVGCCHIFFPYNNLCFAHYFLRNEIAVKEHIRISGHITKSLFQNDAVWYNF